MGGGWVEGSGEAPHLGDWSGVQGRDPEDLGMSRRGRCGLRGMLGADPRRLSARRRVDSRWILGVLSMPNSQWCHPETGRKKGRGRTCGAGGKSTFKRFTLHWGIVDEQCCDSFRHTAKGLSHTCTRVHAAPRPPPTQAAT